MYIKYNTAIKAPAEDPTVPPATPKDTLFFISKYAHNKLKNTLATCSITVAIAIGVA